MWRKHKAQGSKYRQVKVQTGIAFIHTPVTVGCGPEIG